MVGPIELLQLRVCILKYVVPYIAWQVDLMTSANVYTKV